MRGKSISRCSARSLMIAIYNEHSDQMLGSGTGFIAHSDIGPCLVTARHCCTGRDHFTGSLGDKGAIPSELRVYHRVDAGDGTFQNMCVIKSESLYDEAGNPRWYEHITYNDLCDFCIIPLSDALGCDLNFVNTAPQQIEFTDHEANCAFKKAAAEDSLINLHVAVGERVFVIGYPFGAFTGSVLPLWTVGYTSSEPDMRSSFSPHYIDCRARKGQSGSPVYFMSRGALPTRSGDIALLDGTCYSFLGIYTGRINAQSDIGFFWPAELIHETLMNLSRCSRAKLPPERKIGGPISRIITGM